MFLLAFALGLAVGVLGDLDVGARVGLRLGMALDLQHVSVLGAERRARRAW
jgi:hypothetical protein